MQPLYDQLLVSVSRRHDDALGDAVGHNGAALVKATGYDEEIHRTSRATVVAGSLALRHAKGSLQGTPYACAAIRDVPAAGDTVYVEWSALSEAAQPDPVNHPHVYAVGLGQVVALPDGCGGFLGFAGYVLCEPVFPETVAEAAAQVTRTASGLLLVPDVKQDAPMGEESNVAEQVPTRHGVRALPGEGIVRYTGVPLRHQRDDVKAFDHVVFDARVLGRSGYPLRVTLEGREYYAVRRDMIAAVRGRWAPAGETLLPIPPSLPIAA